ncbi:D-aminoacid aminotransferase-like PLP-dependent enzyme [Tuber magnatum]|uniref:Branched-chain-amino-acid aminotransferase n=1 Tax=Tuber magnatum TaxID=42249 RepID=A0A317SW57_9PEZI|nr:D-aminoacid aminotransferase-like PLP-dependent enzyme [Tuber magnatum]
MAPPSALTPDLAFAPVAGSVAESNGTEANNVTHSPAPIDTPEVAELDPSKLKVTITKTPRQFQADSSKIEWGRADVSTDHWITVKWSETEGWAAPQLRPYSPIDLWPTASCLHYATECFEGMKAYRGFDGSLRLFRPAKNTARMLVSSARISLPGFSPSALEELIRVLVATDGPKWLPEPGSFLYVRPTMIGTGGALGVHKPREAMLFIVLSQFPVLYEKNMKLLASREDSIRAWPGGFGFAKVGANYGPSLAAQKEAQARGYDQILWLFDRSCQVTEAGASNFFVIWKNKDTGRVELVTAPLDDKIILDGVTRRSVLELARDRLTVPNGGIQGLDIVERKYTMMDLVDAAKEDRLLEAFAAGTAYFISSVSKIHFRGEDIYPKQTNGTYTGILKTWLKAIMYGEESHEWAVIVPETGFEVDASATEKEINEMAENLRRMKANPAFSAALQKVQAEI